MKNKNTNTVTVTEDGPYQQFEISLDQVSSLDARWEDRRGETPVKQHPGPHTRTQEHMRRLQVGELCETDRRRSAKTEYVMRMLVNGRAPLEEPPAAAPAPPEPERPAVSELLPKPEPEHAAAPEPRAGGMTLENLTFDDLLAELENL